MELIFMSPAWEDYIFWQKTYRKILKCVNELIRQCQRKPYGGIGKPEPLRGNLSGWWSRRIDLEHRLVCRFEENKIYILQYRKNY